jgi:hypothetical protein
MNKQMEESVYKILEKLLHDKEAEPRQRDYERLASAQGVIGIKALKKRFGSYRKTVERFLELYHERNGYYEIPDYLLGCIVGTATLVKSTARPGAALLFSSTRISELDTIKSYLHRYAEWGPNEKGVYFLECYDYKLISSLKAIGFPKSLPFRSTVDFVRGYCDTHASLFTYQNRHGNTCLRMEITGPEEIVSKIREFFVQLGASDTKIQKSPTTYKWHMNTKSLQKVRDMLYPGNCVCYDAKRVLIYSI